MAAGGAALLALAAALAVLWFNTPLLAVWYTRAVWGGPETDPAYREYVTADGIRVLENECYCAEFANSYMDVYLPQEGGGKAILWVHGGGFVSDDKSLVSETAMKFAQAGYAFFNINYALAPEATYPSQLRQLDAAASYIAEHEARYGVQGASFVFGGDSAGGQIAGQYVNLQSDEDYAQAVGLSCTPLRHRIGGVIFYCAFLDFSGTAEETALWRFLSPQFSWALFGTKDYRGTEQAALASIVGNLSEQYPPVFITDGTVGSFAVQAQALIAELEEKHIPYEANLYDPQLHSLPHEYQFDYSLPQAEENLARTLAFLAALP